MTGYKDQAVDTGTWSCEYVESFCDAIGKAAEASYVCMLIKHKQAAHAGTVDVKFTICYSFFWF